MPELPEVEVVGRGVSATALNKTVRDMVIRQRRLRWPISPELPAIIAGQRLLSVRRRGKYLLLDFGNGNLLVHLGMSGNFRFFEPGIAPGVHDHVDLVFDHGTLRFNDPRRFGAMLWIGAPADPLAHPLIASLGVEPFDPAFDAGLLYAACTGRRVTIKQLLLAGRVVVGVGNIYASESLFRAGIRPSTQARRMTRPRCVRLVDAVRATLADAIAQGGSTLRDFGGSDGGGGYFQLSCQVYGRQGEPCRVCGEPIRRAVHQARASYWCVRCQR